MNIYKLKVFRSERFYSYITIFLYFFVCHIYTYADVIDPEKFIKDKGYLSVKLGEDGKTRFYTNTERTNLSRITLLEKEIAKLPKHNDVQKVCDSVKKGVKENLVSQYGIDTNVNVSNCGYSGAIITCAFKYEQGSKSATQLLYSKASGGEVYMVYITENTEPTIEQEDITSVEFLQSVANQYNNGLPMKVDDYTVLLTIAVKPAELVYRYKLINIKTDNKSIEKFMNLQRPIVQNHLCSTPETIQLISKGVNMTSAYYDDKNNFLGRITVSKDTCGVK